MRKKPSETENCSRSLIHLNNIEASKRLNSFYRTVFSSLRKEVYEGYTCYRVFVGRRCLVLAQRYLLQNKDTIPPDILKTLHSDGGLRLVAVKLAEEFCRFRNNFPTADIEEFKHIVILFDDILIHGRTIGALLSDAEDIFADTYLKLSPNSDLLRKDLYDIFLKCLVIRTAFRNSNPSLLRFRYKSRILDEDNKYDPPDWRQFCYEISDSIYRSEVPNAIFVPAVFLNGIISRERVRKLFLQKARKDGMQHFELIKKSYMGRDIDAYICPLTEKSGLSAVLTLRCTDNYLIPFVFLPELDSKQYQGLFRLIDRFLENIAPGLGQIIYKKQEEWNMQNKRLTVLTTELLNALLSAILIRAFLQDIGYPLQGDDEDFVKKQTTVDMTLWNYAHDNDVKKLLYTVFAPSVTQICPLNELIVLLKDFCTQNNRLLFSEIGDITKQKPGLAAEEKARRKIERVVFDYAISSESKANSLIMGSLSPSEQSLQYLFFPSDNTVGDFLRKLYAYRDSWVRRSLPLTEAFYYLLQMMDADYVSLRVGTDLMKPETTTHIQCVKPGEQALNALPYRYADGLPLLAEIERRCKRQHATAINDLNDDLMRFFSGYQNYEHIKGVDLSFFDHFIPEKNRLIYMLYKTISSDQSCRDYMFLLGKRLENNPNNPDAATLIEKIRTIFYRVSY